jgi:O-antigen ligase
LRAPFAGLLLYLCLDFLRPHDVFPVLRSWRPMLVVGSATLLAALWQRRGALLDGGHALLPLLALFGVAALSTVTSIDPARSARTLVEIAKMIAVVWLILVLVSTQRRFDSTLRVIALSLAALALAAVVQGVERGLMREFRVEAVVEGPAGEHDGPFRDNNNLARVLAMSVPLWWILARRAAPLWTRGAAVLGLLLAAVAVEFTFSRSGFVALLVAVAVLASSARPRWRGAAIFLAFVAALALFSPRPYLARIATIGQPLADPSVRERLGIWQRAGESMLERPLQGSGPGTFERPEPGGGSAPRSSHNIFIELFTEMGLAGLAAYAWMLIAALRGLHRARRGAAAPIRTASFGLQAAMLAYLGASLALSSPFQSPLFALIGLSLALARRGER